MRYCDDGRRTARLLPRFCAALEVRAGRRAVQFGLRHCERERRNPVGDWRGVSGFRAWERRGGHQLDRFAFARDDGCEGCACGGYASPREDGY